MGRMSSKEEMERGREKVDGEMERGGERRYRWRGGEGEREKVDGEMERGEEREKVQMERWS